MANNLKNETWKEVKGTNGKYKVSSFGRVIGAALRKSYTTCLREGRMKSYQSKTAGGYHWEYVK